MSKDNENPVFKVAQTTILALTEVEEEMRDIMRQRISMNAASGAGSTLVQAIMAKHSVHMTMFEMAAMGRMAEDQAGRGLYIPTVG
jgi:hypothetical protein